MTRTFTLLKPVRFQENEVKEITLDMDALTGNDMIAAERHFVRSAFGNDSISLKELCKEYQALIAARASNKPAELFDFLSPKDFSRITIYVQRFLLDSELEEEEYI